MMNYRAFIEENFMIDFANTGELVPFKFNPVQEHYYEDLRREYDIERKGLTVPVRENILKARREGFSSLILGLFAADDVTNDNPTESVVLSYKDDATKIFLKRYRTYLLTHFALEHGLTPEQIKENINILEEIAKETLSIDSSDIEIGHNKAHFQCQTAGARVGGRGGVMQKILFSEIAFYQDTDKIRAAEMVEATMRQVDIASGWIFMESTENGIGTYQHKTWTESKKGRNRFKNRFYGAGHFYTREQIAQIKSEYVDMDGFRRDYPMSEDDLFKGSAKNFVQESALEKMVNIASAEKEIVYFIEFRHQSGIDVSEIIESELRRLQDEHPGHNLYVGIDEAKDIDATVVTVIKDRRRALKRSGVQCVAIDTTRGDWLADWFERNTSWYIKRVKFSRPSKSLMFTNLQVVIDGKMTSLPLCKLETNNDSDEVHEPEWVSDEHKHFWQQTLALEKEIIGNVLVVHHPDGQCSGNDHDYDDCLFHDDYPDSWCLAEDAYFDINGVPKKKVKPETPTVPNQVKAFLEKGTIRDRHRGRGSSRETSYE